MYRTNLITRSLLAAIVATVFATQTSALAGSGTAGSCDPPSVPVRAKFRMTNNTGQTAHDFHFYMYQNDKPHVHVTGAEASSSTFGNVSVGLGTDNGKTPPPPPGNHGAGVDMDGGTVAPGGTLTVEVTLCMNEKNCIKIKDAYWTDENHDPIGAGGPGGAPGGGGAPPPHGWRIKDPVPGGNGGGGPGEGAQEGNGGVGNWVHLICIENDGPKPIRLEWIKLLASTTYYADIEDIDWALIPTIVDPSGEPPVVIPAYSQWCYRFQTTGSFLNGHVYLNYEITELAKDAGDNTMTFGDHPIPAEDLDDTVTLELSRTEGPCTFAGEVVPFELWMGGVGMQSEDWPLTAASGYQALVQYDPTQWFFAEAQYSEAPFGEHFPVQDLGGLIQLGSQISFSSDQEPVWGDYELAKLFFVAQVEHPFPPQLVPDPLANRIWDEVQVEIVPLQLVNNQGPLLGDLNCDNALDLFDIDPFVQALTSAPSGFEEYYFFHPGCDPFLADINCDGSVDNFDIDPFVALLTGG